MNREQIVKALECCSKDDCDNCPNYFGNCYANLAGEALSLIKELTEENERLQKANDVLLLMPSVADVKSDTVRKIFEEIEKFGKRPIPEAKPVYILKQRDLDEIRNKHIPRGTPPDTCASCGVVIPEGIGLYCPNCQGGNNE